MNRPYAYLNAYVLLAGLVTAIATTQAVGQPICRPTLAFKDVGLSAMQPPTLERKWTAIVSVDASHCAANARGSFTIAFLRVKETGPDTEFKQQFVWQAPSVEVAIDFWADEAVQAYWFDNIAACPCGE